MWIAMLMGAVVETDVVIQGSLSERVATTPADVVLLYAGEHKGSLETCGCPKRPRGSLSRLEAYRKAAGPSLLVNAGYWLEDPTGFDGVPKPDVIESNRWMVKGLRAGAWDALNVTPFDVAAGLPDELPLVSANITGPGIQPWVVVEHRGLRVGITGIAGEAPTLGKADGYTFTPPQKARAVIDELATRTDLVVLLAWRADEAARALAQKADVDVVVDADSHRDVSPVETVGRALRVATTYQTMRLGELRLDLDGGAVADAHNRNIDLDPEVPDDPDMLALQTAARSAIDAVQRSSYP